MWEIAELWSGSATPLPPPHPAQKNRTARARSGTRNTGVPAPTEAAAQAVLPQQWVRAVAVPAFPSLHLWTKSLEIVPPLPEFPVAAGGGCAPHSWLSNKLLHCGQKLFTGEGLGYVSIRTLLLGPEFVTVTVLGADQHHRNPRIFSMSLELTAGLKAVALGHDHVHQNQAGTLHVNHLLNAHGIVYGYARISTTVQNRLHQPDFRRRIVNNENLLQNGQTPSHTYLYEYSNSTTKPGESKDALSNVRHS